MPVALELPGDDAGTIMEVDPPAVDPPQSLENRRYETRASNRDRHPGLHLGRNWREEREEQEAQLTERARKKAETAHKKASKEAAAGKVVAGINHLAALELAREREEAADAEARKARTARGYRALASAIRTQDAEATPSEHTSGTGSEYEDGGKEFSDTGSEDGEEEVEPEEVEVAPKPTKKVRGQMVAVRERL